MNRQKWDNRFLDLAQHIASWSKDPSTQVGAVITEGNRIVSLGYNGLPAEMLDLDFYLQNREVKYEYIIHAEMNALLFAKRDLKDCTIYTWPFMACARCASMLVQAGIKRFVAPVSSNERWDFESARQLIKKAGATLYELDLPPKDKPLLDPLNR